MERISVKTVFWFLVIYLISSLLWWTFEHLRSNEMMFEIQKEQLQLQWSTCLDRMKEAKIRKH